MNDSYSPGSPVVEPGFASAYPLRNFDSASDTRHSYDFSVARDRAPAFGCKERPSDVWHAGERWSLSPEYESSSRRVVFMGDICDGCGLDILLDVAHHVSVAVDVIGSPNRKGDSYRMLAKLDLGRLSGGDIFHGPGSMLENLRLIRNADAVFVSSMDWYDRATFFISENQQTIGFLNLDGQFDESDQVLKDPQNTEMLRDRSSLRQFFSLLR